MDGQWPVTRSVRKAALVASELDWILSPEATVFVLAPSFWWLCTKQPDGSFSYVDGDDAAAGSLGG